MALVAERGFRRNLGTGKSLSFVRHLMRLYLLLPVNFERLFEFCLRAIQAFAHDHQHETFYAFSIDAALLCLNSEEAFAKTLSYYQAKWEREHREVTHWNDLTAYDHDDLEGLARYSKLDLSDQKASLSVLNEWRSQAREKGNPYLNPEEIRELRFNTGDWAYQGFATMSKDVGFDERLYWEDHYYLDEKRQKTSRYARTMDKLLAKLVAARALAVPTVWWTP
ncbi:MAG: hypothetical protein ACKOEO_00100 [Planctomycetaceae bacterium]